MTDRAPRTRLTSRILVLDEGGRALLFLTRGSVPAQPTRWITPGGGVDPGESHHDAACRELFEETGMVVDDLGEPVWVSDFEVDYAGGDHDRGHAEYFLLRTSAFTPSSDAWTPEEHVDIVEHRWWAAGELAASGVPIEPVDLPTLIEAHAVVGRERAGHEQAGHNQVRHEHAQHEKKEQG